MKMKIYLYLTCLTFCIFAFLTGCKHEQNKLNSIEAMTSPAVPQAPEVPDPGTPEAKPESLESNEAVPKETIAQELSKDIDQNGVMDLVQIMEREDGTEFVQVIFNGVNIYQYEWEELRLISIDAFEYLDLDGCGENEIFITIYPNVNSRPLIEVLTLKQASVGWNRMELPLNELGNNCFLFDITRGKDEFDFIISSEYTDQTIHFDASSFFVNGPYSNPDSLQAYRNNHYKEGDKVAFISAWGIWEAKIGTYNERNCIIAQQGIEGPYGNFLGRVIIYYDYDINGFIEVLNIEYVF